MNYVKKMCILRQIKQGFSGDGKALSGLIKVEQYGKNLAVEVSVINFAPLASGEYFCLLSDGKGKTEMLSLRGKSIFNILTDIDVSGGFCGIICYVKNDVIPIAYGINGNGSYDWKRILNASLPPVFPKSEPFAAELAGSVPPVSTPAATADNTTAKESTPTSTATQEEQAVTRYDDESVATENYYKEQENEREQLEETLENARAQSTAQKQGAQEGADPAQDADSARVLHPFKTGADGYYYSVKEELEELFKTYPRDDTLKPAFSCSEWVRIYGEKDAPQYLVGVLYENGSAQYICYALAAKDKEAPPREIEGVCTYVPVNALQNADGFYVIFQSAANGECVRPEQA